MKDTDKRTLRSVLLTLGLQENDAVLPDDLINACRAFATNPNASVMELHQAMVATSLAETYQSIRTWLSGLAAEQGLSGEIYPNDKYNKIPPELENMVRDTGVANRQLQALLAAIDANLDKTNQILSADNLPQTIRQLNEASES
ncbi:hypothetical protein [Nodosilinea sp. P-1105]|uniref:hypothetical protein n=1 Tax=Nodosilinea sp. P-1105 TaxID=2546229 RepID=UPI00146A9698|nr:hypothetical protein [Nodosilinea sp. P-1105]NMF82695.1 hypothetical protein [Nodosilinea sp. P-1105]